MNTLNYMKKMNRAAKYCGSQKQNYYNKGEYEKTRYYKQEQNEIYLLKSLLALNLVDMGILVKKERCQGDRSGTILETFASADGNYYYHAISENQEAEESEIINQFEECQKAPIVKNYLPYKRFLEKQLTGKYKKIYDIIKDCDYFFSAENKKENKELERLIELGITGTIYKTRYDFYYCDLHLDGIRLCNITAYVREQSDYFLFNRDGILKFVDTGETDLFDLIEWNDEYYEECYEE